jgi:hypothetical protein
MVRHEQIRKIMNRLQDMGLGGSHRPSNMIRAIHQAWDVDLSVKEYITIAGISTPGNYLVLARNLYSRGVRTD